MKLHAYTNRPKYRAATTVVDYMTSEEPSVVVIETISPKLPSAAPPFLEDILDNLTASLLKTSNVRAKESALDHLGC